MNPTDNNEITTKSVYADQDLRELISRQKPGWTLDQPFYVATDIFKLEKRTWLSEQWYIVGHASELPRAGSYVVRQLLGESLIIVRDQDRGIIGFYNVCPHRGCRLAEQDGRAASFVCPYHAWTFSLDGSLKQASGLPPSADISRLALRRIVVREISGIIFATLHLGSADFSDHLVNLTNLLEYHGISCARIACQKSYPINANWKLVIDNFLECYHCFPCHPEISAMRAAVKVQGQIATAEAIAAWEQMVEDWARDQADKDSPVPISTSRVMFDMNSIDFYRIPIGNAYETESRDGRPVAPLMGKVKKYDGGSTGFCIQPFCYVTCCSDHIVMFQFDPEGPDHTMLTLTWLVDGGATEEKVDVERMTWLWDTTTKQDQSIIERNAAGVRSSAYRPGPYSVLESLSSENVNRYLSRLTKALDPDGAASRR